MFLEKVDYQKKVNYKSLVLICFLMKALVFL